MKANFIEHVQTFTARGSVTASATRGQGAPRIAERARERLRAVALGAFAVRSRGAFDQVLELETERLKSALPAAGRSWGLSRKLLNIFLRDSLYTIYLRESFGLARAEEWFEVPLDSVVTNRLAQEPEGQELPAWPGVKHLTPTESAIYQHAFRMVARRLGVAPVHLDAWYWGGDRDPAA